MNIQAAPGQRCYELINDLYPICRSITGNGVRKTLNIISREIPLRTFEIKSGTQVFDWTIPFEWNINDAFVLNPKGEKIIDFQKSNLHLLNYSIPFFGKIGLEDLKKHLFTLPGYPDWIPYRTSYFHPNWGFCLRHNDFLNLEDGTYDVHIDSSLTPGSLTYGECFIPGKSEHEVLVSTHICHPSLCNDNLSGISVATMLATYLLNRSNNFSYRFLFIPGTIGSITWLNFNRKKINRIKHGFVLTLLGDKGKFHYKKSRIGNSMTDRMAEYALKNAGVEYELREYIPYGYDERQYCSPGFNLPVGRLTRTPHDEFPEYHTSNDNLDLVSPENLQQSYELLLDIFDILENNRRFISLNPYCEPQLGKRGLYSQIGAGNGVDKKETELSLLWMLNQSDGISSIVDISEKSGLKFKKLKAAADMLESNRLILEMKDPVERKAWFKGRKHINSKNNTQ